MQVGCRPLLLLSASVLFVFVCVLFHDDAAAALKTKQRARSRFSFNHSMGSLCSRRWPNGQTPLAVLVVSFTAQQKSDCRRSGGQGWVLHCAEKLTWGKTRAQVVSATKSIAPPRNVWWTLTDSTYKADTLSLALTAAFRFSFLFLFFSFILVLVPCLCICRSLLSLIVMVTLIGRNILSR